MAEKNKNKAILHRMVMDNHICPFGIKSKALLEREGYIVEDHHLTSREETDKFKQKHKVETTPQTFIDHHRIGGYDDLLAYFGQERLSGKNGSDYQPVIAVFATSFLMAIAAVWAMSNSFAPIPIIELFVAFSMCILAVLKLRDLFSFSNMFITYDLLGMRYPRYAYIYPFAEAFVGIGMIANTLHYVVAPIALIIGSIGAASVFKAVYIDKRDLKCACVGGDSDVPLGFVSLTENLMMVAMGLWMIIAYIII